jgi:aminoglycoside N3'-acetyltransferase
VNKSVIQHMDQKVSIASLESDFVRLGLGVGDAVMIRAELAAVGRIDRQSFIQALLNVVGEEGTIISLAFTPGTFFWKVSKFPPFKVDSPSYAGALPNAMLRDRRSHRSMHPQCSYVAIGKHAQYLTLDHGPDSGAYEPVRKLIGLKGKMMLVGCVGSSPGFTTTHLAEIDLGIYKRVIAPWLVKCRYIRPDGTIAEFLRTDPGLCSHSFWKFYAYYVRNGVLLAGHVGSAYSVVADAERCYQIDRSILEKDPGFNICESLDCTTCNLLRWDRIYMWPVFGFRRALRLHKSSKKK